MRHAGLFVLATSVVWTMLACRGFDHHSAQGGSLQVELDAFSGQPNPRWELTADESAEFLAQFQKLNRASSSGTAFEGLGYRGFLVTGSVESLRGYDTVKLYGGKVIAQAGDRAESFEDPDRRLERWLLLSAHGRIPEQVSIFVKGQIDAGPARH